MIQCYLSAKIRKVNGGKHRYFVKVERKTVGFWQKEEKAK